MVRHYRPAWMRVIKRNSYVYCERTLVLCSWKVFITDPLAFRISPHLVQGYHKDKHSSLSTHNCFYKTFNTQIQGAQCEWVNSPVDEVSKY